MRCVLGPATGSHGPNFLHIFLAGSVLSRQMGIRFNDEAFFISLIECLMFGKTDSYISKTAKKAPSFTLLSFRDLYAEMTNDVSMADQLVQARKKEANLILGPGKIMEAITRICDLNGALIGNPSGFDEEDMTSFFRAFWDCVTLKLTVRPKTSFRS